MERERDDDHTRYHRDISADRGDSQREHIEEEDEDERESRHEPDAGHRDRASLLLHRSSSVALSHTSPGTGRPAGAQVREVGRDQRQHARRDEGSQSRKEGDRRVEPAHRTGVTGLATSSMAAITWGHTRLGTSWPIPTISSNRAPGMAAATLRPLSTGTSGSASPWTTRAGTSSERSRASRLGAARIARSCPANPAGGSARSMARVAFARSHASSNGSARPSSS